MNSRSETTAANSLAKSFDFAECITMFKANQLVSLMENADHTKWESKALTLLFRAAQTGNDHWPLFKLLLHQPLHFIWGSQKQNSLFQAAAAGYLLANQQLASIALLGHYEPLDKSVSYALCAIRDLRKWLLTANSSSEMYAEVKVGIEQTTNRVKDQVGIDMISLARMWHSKSL